MVVDTVAEEHPLRIGLKFHIIIGCPVAGIVLKGILEHFPDIEVIPAVLHPYDVAAILCSFCKMVDVFLLLKRKGVPSRNLIPHHLDIGKFIKQELEVTFISRLVRAGHQGRGQTCT